MFCKFYLFNVACWVTLAHCMYFSCYVVAIRGVCNIFNCICACSRSCCLLLSFSSLEWARRLSVGSLVANLLKLVTASFSRLFGVSFLAFFIGNDALSLLYSLLILSVSELSLDTFNLSMLDVLPMFLCNSPNDGSIPFSRLQESLDSTRGKSF